MNTIEELINESIKKTLREGNSGTPISGLATVPSADRTKLEDLYKELFKQLENTEYKVLFNQDHISIYIKGEDQDPNFDYTPYMTSILEYLNEKGEKVYPLPNIKLKKDLTEAQGVFGKTAYYDPNLKEVILYTHQRHPKDVLRSFVHEMIHHSQNLKGILPEITTTDTNNDKALEKIEMEAYLKGNTYFRKWEDKQKNK